MKPRQKWVDEKKELEEKGYKFNAKDECVYDPTKQVVKEVVKEVVKQVVKKVVKKVKKPVKKPVKKVAKTKIPVFSGKILKLPKIKEKKKRRR